MGMWWGEERRGGKRAGRRKRDSELFLLNYGIYVSQDLEE